jgi:hypothetical protein
MIVQINTDNNVDGNESFVGPFRDQIYNSLKRFESRVTSFQVHLGDENGSKGGAVDKRCVIEARIDGMQPHAVTCHDETHQKAVNGAIDKIKAVLDSVFEKQRNH